MHTVQRTAHSEHSTPHKAEEHINFVAFVHCHCWQGEHATHRQVVHFSIPCKMCAIMHSFQFDNESHTRTHHFSFASLKWVSDSEWNNHIVSLFFIWLDRWRNTPYSEIEFRENWHLSTFRNLKIRRGEQLSLQKTHKGFCSLYKRENPLSLEEIVFLMKKKIDCAWCPIFLLHTENIPTQIV